ncbi:MAG: bleomycin resistance protein [Flavobacteriaceae bacterium]|nr:MAG: bleomycin resistance protein [Flavobacteriaceae bacterium]
MNKKQNIKETIPFLKISDMEISLEFYIKGLGFEILHSWTPDGKIQWCQLKRGAGSLMLQKGKNMKPNKETSSRKENLGISIYFICQDALKIYEELVENGIDATEPFVSNNMWLTIINDPDGYEINFESATDVSEETRLSEWKEKK